MSRNSDANASRSRQNHGEVVRRGRLEVRRLGLMPLPESAAFAQPNVAPFNSRCTRRSSSPIGFRDQDERRRRGVEQPRADGVHPYWPPRCGFPLEFVDDPVNSRESLLVVWKDQHVPAWAATARQRCSTLDTARAAIFHDVSRMKHRSGRSGTLTRHESY